MTLIERCFRDAISAASGGDRDARITLEVVGDPSKWVQLSSDDINLVYPGREPPLEKLRKLSIKVPEDMEVSDWQANLFVTFEHGAEPLHDLVRFVEDYMSKVLGVPPIEGRLHVVEEP